nr:hypothetical protein HK105_000604 [Polyrhizophydium stewartii]
MKAHLGHNADLLFGPPKDLAFGSATTDYGGTPMRDGFKDQVQHSGPLWVRDAASATAPWRCVFGVLVMDRMHSRGRLELFRDEQESALVRAVNLAGIAVRAREPCSTGSGQPLCPFELVYSPGFETSSTNNAWVSLLAQESVQLRNRWIAAIQNVLEAQEAAKPRVAGPTLTQEAGSAPQMRLCKSPAASPSISRSSTLAPSSAAVAPAAEDISSASHSQVSMHDEHHMESSDTVAGPRAAASTFEPAGSDLALRLDTLAATTAGIEAATVALVARVDEAMRSADGSTALKGAISHALDKHAEQVAAATNELGAVLADRLTKLDACLAQISDEVGAAVKTIAAQASQAAHTPVRADPEFTRLSTEIAAMRTLLQEHAARNAASASDPLVRSVHENHAAVSTALAQIGSQVGTLVAQLRPQTPTASITSPLRGGSGNAPGTPGSGGDTLLDRPTKSLMVSMNEKLIQLCKLYEHAQHSAASRFSSLEERLARSQAAVQADQISAQSSAQRIEKAVQDVRGHLSDTAERIAKLARSQSSTAAALTSQVTRIQGQVEAMLESPGITGTSVLARPKRGKRDAPTSGGKDGSGAAQRAGTAHDDRDSNGGESNDDDAAVAAVSAAREAVARGFSQIRDELARESEATHGRMTQLVTMFGVLQEAMSTSNGASPSSKSSDGKTLSDAIGARIDEAVAKATDALAERFTAKLQQTIAACEIAAQKLTRAAEQRDAASSAAQRGSAPKGGSLLESIHSTLVNYLPLDLEQKLSFIESRLREMDAGGNGHARAAGGAAPAHLLAEWQQDIMARNHRIMEALDAIQQSLARGSGGGPAKIVSVDDGEVMKMLREIKGIAVKAAAASAGGPPGGKAGEDGAKMRREMEAQVKSLEEQNRALAAEVAALRGGRRGSAGGGGSPLRGLVFAGLSGALGGGGGGGSGSSGGA